MWEMQCMSCNRRPAAVMVPPAVYRSGTHAATHGPGPIRAQHAMDPRCDALPDGHLLLKRARSEPQAGLLALISQHNPTLTDQLGPRVSRLRHQERN
jgi:hypothetical protein